MEAPEGVHGLVQKYLKFATGLPAPEAVCRQMLDALESNYNRHQQRYRNGGGGRHLSRKELRLVIMDQTIPGC